MIAALYVELELSLDIKRGKTVVSPLAWTNREKHSS
jgi:hypothetical protein